MSIPVAAVAVMRLLPSIEWEKPVLVPWSPTMRRHACRVCIAAYGITCESTWQWTDKATAEQHIKSHFE